MNKKLCSFLFFSCLISVGHNSFASSSKRYRNQNKCDTDLGHTCLCHESKWLTGLQIFGSFDIIANYSGGEIAMARFLNPNINSFYRANLQNKLEANKKGIIKVPNYFDECFKANDFLIWHFGFDGGLRYRWGRAIDGYGLSASLGYKEIVRLNLKAKSDETMINDLKQKGMSRSDLKTVQQMRDKLDNRTIKKSDENGSFYKLPESLKGRLWNADVLFEFYHCFIGNLLETEELFRKNFCLVGYHAIGARINFWNKVSDDIFKEAPKENKEFSDNNLLKIVPISKFGLQAILKNGLFFDVSLLLQVLTIPGLLAIPIPCPSFFSPKVLNVDEEVLARNFGTLKILAAVNPQISLSFGYDFYGLCVGEKLEEYYDN